MNDAVAPHTDRVGSIRYKLVLAKVRVESVAKTPFGFQFALELPGVEKKMIVTAPPSSDIREGDLLTLYTEILSASSIEPSKQ